MEDYKEVTDAQKTQMEKADAKWETPPQWLIDVFNSDINGRYNEATGYFELNGLKDLSTEDARVIAKYGNMVTPRCYQGGETLRTNLSPVNVAHNGHSNLCSYGFMFHDLPKLEVVNLYNEDNRGGTYDYRYGMLLTGDVYAMFYAPIMRKVIGAINLRNKPQDMDIMFKGAPSLEDVLLTEIDSNISFVWCPKVSLYTLSSLIKYKYNTTTAVVVTVHPDTYAKIMDGDNTEWHQLLTDGAAKALTFATE